MNIYWMWISGMLLGIEWAEDDGWISLNLLIIKIVIAYKKGFQF